MRKLLFNNTYKSGKITLIVFSEKSKYIGVCLEFDLVVEGKTMSEAKELIEDYAQLWHKNVVQNKLSEEMLNRPAQKKYWDIYKLILNIEQKKIEAERKSTSIDVPQPNQPSVSMLPYNTKFSTMAFC